MTKATRSQIGLVILIIVLVGQILAFLRYWQRVPDDRLGLMLFATVIAATVAAVLLLVERVGASTSRD